MLVSRTTKTTNPTADALASAKADLVSAREAHAEAVAALNLITRQLAAGLGDHSAEDFASARNRADWAALRVDGFQQAVKRAKRAERPTAPDLADVLAPWISKALGKVCVSTATTAPTEAPADALPAVVPVQAKPNTVDTGSGALRGQVELWYIRTDLHSAPDAYRLGCWLDDHGIRLKSAPVNAGSRKVGDQTADIIRLDVTAAFPELPVIDSGDPAWHAQQLAHGFKRDVEGLLGKVLVKTTGEAIGEAVDAEGVRTTHIKVSALAWPAKHVPTLERFKVALHEAVEGYRGKAVGGLGRVSEVAVTSYTPGVVTPAGRGNGGSIVAALTFLSQEATA